MALGYKKERKVDVWYFFFKETMMNVNKRLPLLYEGKNKKWVFKQERLSQTLSPVYKVSRSFSQ